MICISIECENFKSSMTEPLVMVHGLNIFRICFHAKLEFGQLPVK